MALGVENNGRQCVAPYGRNGGCARALQPPRGELATDETVNLISADKVVGTAVYNRMSEASDRFTA
jgi:hypothetical protein